MLTLLNDQTVYMRSYLLLSGIVFIISGSIYSQNNIFTSGLIINANGIHIEGQDSQYWSGSSGEIWGTGGLSGGAFVKRQLSDHFYTSMELRYVRKGSIYEFINDQTVISYEILKLNYVELPLVLGYIYRPYKKYRIFETGFSVAKMFSSRLALDELNNRNGTPEISQFRELDVSWVGAAKFPINRLKANNLLFGIRVSHSLFSIHEFYKLYNFIYGLQLDYLF